MSDAEKADIVEQLLEAMLEDGQASWMDPAPRYAQRSHLLSNALDEIERLRALPSREAVLEAALSEVTRMADVWRGKMGCGDLVYAAAEIERAIRALKKDTDND